MIHNLVGATTCIGVVYVLFLGTLDFFYQLTGWLLHLLDRPVS